MTQAKLSAFKAIRLAFKVLSGNLKFFIPVALLWTVFGWLQIPIEAELQKQWNWFLALQDSLLAFVLMILSLLMIAGGGLSTASRDIRLRSLVQMFRSKTSWLMGYSAVGVAANLASVFATRPDGTVGWPEGEPSTSAAVTLMCFTVAISIYLILFQCPMLLEERSSFSQLLRNSGRFTAIYLFRFFVLGFLICLPYIPLALVEIFVTKGLNNPVTYVIDHWPLPPTTLLFLALCALATMLVGTLFQIALVILYRDFQQKHAQEESAPVPGQVRV